jgi:acyl dehydratase
MPGRYYEQLEVGQVIAHEVRRTVTEGDNIQFSTLSMNPQRLHLDYEFAKESIHGKPLVNGMFTFALMMGLTVNELTQGTTEGNLGFEQVEFPKPVFYGDTIRAETKVLGKRESGSRPNLGIVQFEHRALNQRGEVVLRCKRAGLMRKLPQEGAGGR